MKLFTAPAKPETVLVLRTCTKEMTSHNGFKWPESGAVEAKDWRPTKECGNGLHGWLWGQGNWGLKAKGEDIRWLVVEAEKSSLIDLDGKVKFPRGNVIATLGHWRDAMAFIRQRRPFDPKAGTTATGYSGHAAATGNYGHAAATGDSGHAAATGNSGHAAATGNSGWAIVGLGGRAKAGKDGVLTLLWSDGKRKRVAVGYVGEGGIKDGVWYSASARGEIVKADDQSPLEAEKKAA